MGFIIFITGFCIFTTYVMFYMFSPSQETRNEVTLKDDNVDYDGHGNWGRFPPTKQKGETRMKRLIAKILLWWSYKKPSRDRRKKSIWEL